MKEYRVNKLERFLKAVVDSATFLNPQSDGGAHTDVLKIDSRLLSGQLRAMCADENLHPDLEHLAGKISERFLLKRGKIKNFSMRIVGNKENILQRSTMSWAFGPVGFSLHPTVEKVVDDCTGAVRLIPYLGAGAREQQVAPDVLTAMEKAVSGRPHELAPARGEPYISYLQGNSPVSTIFQLIEQDPFFQARIGKWQEMKEHQIFMRRSPISRELADKLVAFFNAPITVGLHDLIRFANGSRHPDFGWEQARDLILECYDKWSTENFILPELNYYAVDMDLSAEDLAEIRAGNVEVVNQLLPRFRKNLPRKLTLEGDDLAGRLLYELLDFHHDYPIYDIEPYQGLISISMLKTVARFMGLMVMWQSGMSIREPRNTELQHLVARPSLLAETLASLTDEEGALLLEAMEDVLSHYSRTGGVLAMTGKRVQFKRIERTFYCFQERADYYFHSLGEVVRVMSLEDLWSPENLHLFDEIPELSEKLLVFFVQAYRHYLDTGFVADFRPKNAGRDIFIYGIWGHCTENIIVTIYKDPDGERHAGIRYVDNKDQFKEYRREEDRTIPRGLAKNALRLTGDLIEPALIRTVGLFTELVHRNHTGKDSPREDLAAKLGKRGLDIIQVVAHQSIDRAFRHVHSFVDDLVDDMIEGARRVGAKKK